MMLCVLTLQLSTLCTASWCNGEQMYQRMVTQGSLSETSDSHECCQQWCGECVDEERLPQHAQVVARLKHVLLLPPCKPHRAYMNGGFMDHQPDSTGSTMAANKEATESVIDKIDNEDCQCNSCISPK